MKDAAQFTLRKGTPADAADLSKFAARSFADAFAAENRPEDMQQHLKDTYGLAQQTEELLNENVATLLVHMAGTLLAYAQVRPNTPPACVSLEGPIEVHRFYVDRSAHGSGIAQKLMSAVHDAANDFRGLHLWLSVWEENPRALAFYGKEGFTDAGSTDFFVGPDRQTDRVLISSVRRKI